MTTTEVDPIFVSYATSRQVIADALSDLGVGNSVDAAAAILIRLHNADITVASSALIRWVEDDIGVEPAFNTEGVELWMGPSGHVQAGAPSIPQPGWRRIYVAKV